MNIKPSILLLLTGILISLPFLPAAQNGKYFTAYGLGQYNRITNSDDFFSLRTLKSIDPVDTYSPGAGLGYINNFTDKAGYNIGIQWARQGQKYQGEIFDKDSNIVQYRSAVKLEYVKFPLMLQLNSTLGGEVNYVFLSIGIGFQVDVLTGVSTYTQPDYDRNGLSIDYKELYTPVTTSFVAHATFHFKLTDQWYIVSGVKMDRTLGDIENKGYNFSGNAPLEWYFPVSTKKNQKPDLSIRDNSKNSIFSLSLGIGFKLPQ